MLIEFNRPKAVPVIIIINLVIYLLWNYTPSTQPDLMSLHFLVSWEALAAGRYWTLLTSAFSHLMLWHLFMNMYVLNSFGPVLEQALGTSRFIKFYLVAAVISSFSHAVVSAWLLNEPDLSALGASGAISGILLLFSLLFPKERIYLLGIIPMRVAWAAVLIIGLDLWGLMAQAGGGGTLIGHGAHLGGALTGILYYFIFSRRNR